MAVTAQELADAWKVYASGALVVVFEGKRVEYPSGADLLKRIRVIEAEIALAAGATVRRPASGVAGYRRG